MILSRGIICFTSASRQRSMRMCFQCCLIPTRARPNAPIRQLVSMMILKDGFGWSDAQLFERCLSNIQVMGLLGLMNLSDEVPAESAYNSFRHALYADQLEAGRDLIGETFSSLTRT